MNPSYIDFFEERLDLGINFGAVGGPSFNTKIVTNGAGEETRNAEWWQPLGRWQLGEKMLLDSDAESIAELQYLKDFHRDRRGSYQAFRFRDWADYKVVRQQIGTTDGQTRIWQLKKTYTAGDVIFNRPITKPVVGSVRVFLNGGYLQPTIDSVNGLIIFDEPPLANQIITADFEFDVPVIFEADKIEYKLKAAQLQTGEYLHRLGSVFVKEIKINLVIPWYEFFAPPELLNVPLDLGTILDTNETTAIRTREEKTVSGFERRQSGYSDPKTVIKLPSKKFDREELNLLLGYFWVAKGKCASFFLTLNSKVYWCRFNADGLSIKFSAKSENYALYEVSGLNFYVFGDLSFIDKQTYVKPIADSTSMQPEDLERVEAAMSQLKNLLKTAVYGDEATTAKYFKPYTASGSERWLLNATQDLRDSPTDPNKQVFLMWVHETNPEYHNTDGTADEPTEIYSQDLANFLATYPDRDKFKVIVYAVFSNSYTASQLSEFNAFEAHLNNAINGTNSYPVALKDYQFSNKTITTDNATSIFYLKQLFN